MSFQIVCFPDIWIIFQARTNCYFPLNIQCSHTQKIALFVLITELIICSFLPNINFFGSYSQLLFLFEFTQPMNGSPYLIYSCSKQRLQ